MNDFIQPFLTSLCVALAATPLIRMLALRYNFMERPQADRWHKMPTARYGGIAIFAAFMAGLFIFAPVKGTLFWAFALGGTMAFGLGLFDDIFHITPYTKLAFQIIIACCMVLMGITFKSIINPVFSIPITIFWFVAVMNAFNILDNMDGLCAGIAVITAGAIFAYYGFNGNYLIALIACVTAASSLGFLIYNFYPAKIFMGDCGSMFLGFMFATCAVVGTWSYISNLVITTMAVPVLVLALPVFDTILVTLTRRSHGRPFHQGGRDHASHRLVGLGMSERRAVVTLYIVSFSFVMLVLLRQVLNLAVSAVLVSCAAILLVFFGFFLNGVRVYPEYSKPAVKGGVKQRIILSGMIYHKRRIIEVVVDLAIICIAYVSAYLLRYEGIVSERNLQLIVTSLPVIIIIRMVCFFAFGLYRGVWKYAGLHDLVSIFKAVTVGSVAIVLYLVFFYRFHSYSRALFVIDWLLMLVSISGVRIILRLFREFFASISKEGRRILIVGAGDAGELMLREIRHNAGLELKPIGFVDDDPRKLRNKIHGLKIMGTRDDIPRLVLDKRIDEVILAIPSLADEEAERIADICDKSGIAYKKMAEII